MRANIYKVIQDSMVCKCVDLVAWALGCCGGGKIPELIGDINLFVSSQVSSNELGSAPESLLQQGHELLGKCTTMSEFAKVYNDKSVSDRLKE
jgi:hypothetical protein